MEPDSGISALIRAQGNDGGWGYVPGSGSWTEPTALALLALSETPAVHDAVARGRKWLVQMQRSDGGWPPCAAVDQSTWVTAFASLALADCEPIVLEHASAWLLNQRGRGESHLDRLRNWLMREQGDQTPPGWSWYPATASWVFPTAASLLALEKISGRSTDLTRDRIANGRGFLLARQCPEGGWHHGGTFVRSENAPPYPETTGLALLALRNANAQRFTRSISRAISMFSSPQSVQGSAWLQMGLASVGVDAPVRGDAPPQSRTWTTVDIAVQAIASLARNPLLT